MKDGLFGALIKLISFVVLAHGEIFAAFYCPLPGKNKKVFNLVCLFFPFSPLFLSSFLFKCYWLLNSGIRMSFVKPFAGWWRTDTVA